MSELYTNLRIEINNKEWTQIPNRDIATLYRNNQGAMIVLHIAHDDVAPDEPEYTHDVEGIIIAGYQDFVTFPELYYWVRSVDMPKGEIVLSIASPSLLMTGVNIEDLMPA